MSLQCVDPATDLEAYLGLEELASAPYSQFVYGDLVIARRYHRLLVEQRVGELASPAGKLFLDGDGGPVAMLAGPLVGAALTQQRFKTATVLRRQADFIGDPGIRARMQLASTTLVPMRSTDAYLSRIAVAPAARGRGYADALIEMFLAEAAALGASSAVLEVSPEHEPALRLYRRFNFVETGSAEVEDAESGRTLRYRHMAKNLIG